MAMTTRDVPFRALRWDFVTDPPTKLLADLAAARVRLRRGQYRLAKAAARRLLRTFRAETPGLPADSAVSAPLAEIRASAVAVQAIAAARLDEPEAVDTLAESLEAFGDCGFDDLKPPALALLGMVLALCQRAEESVEPFVRAMVAGEDVLADLVRASARSLSAAGADEQAVRLLRAAYVRYPREPDLLSDLAQALSAAGDAAGAAEASVAAGALYAELEQFDASLDYFALAESLVEGHPLGALGRCQALAAVGRIPEALSVIDELEQRQPQLAGVRAVRAITLYQAGSSEEARAVVDEALRVFPDDPWLLDTRIRLLVASIELESAQQAIDHALQIDNTDREWQCLRAEVLLAREPGNAEAVQLLQELAAAIPDGVTPVARVTSALAEAGQPATALRAIERALDDHQGEPALLGLKVKLLSVVGRHAEAVTLARHALAQGLDAATLALPLVDSLLALRRYDEALREAESLLAVDPHSAAARRARGLALHACKRYSDALVDLDSVLAGPDSEVEAALADSLTHVGLDKAVAGESETARRLLERAAEIQPTNVVAHAALADLFLKARDYALALRHADRGLDVDPSYATLIGTRGQILHGLHNDGHAEQELRRALEIEPDLAWARTELGDLLRIQRRYKESIQQLQLAIDSAPSDPWPLACKGAAEYSLDRYDKAWESLSHALELKEDYAWAHGVLAAVLNDVDRLEEAIKHSERSLELDPALSWVWEVRGGLWLLQAPDLELGAVRSSASSAKACYSAALEIEPDSWEAHLGLGESMLLLDQADAGLQELDQTIGLMERQDASDADTQAGLGWALLRIGKYDEAVDAFVRALALDSRHVSASFDLCLALLCRDDAEVAFEEFSQAAARLKTVRHPGRRRFLTRRARRDLRVLTREHLLTTEDAQRALGLLDSMETRNA